MNSLDIDELRKKLVHLKDHFGVILYGSHVEGSARPTSDIDIVIVSHNDNQEENLNLQKRLLGVLPLIFDIRVFELFPIFVQISVIETYDVIYGDRLDISEYFYSYRKKWNDCKHRILSNQHSSYRERLSLIK